MKMHGKWKAPITFACSAVFSSCTWANMTVSPMLVSTGGKHNTPVIIEVASQAPDTQYVKVTVKRVLDPATPQEREEVATNWDGNGLIASPQKFALSPGATRSVRLVGLSAPEQEQVFRVYFEPVAAPQEEDASPTEKKASAAARVRMNIVWGVLVRLLPAQPRHQLIRAEAGKVLHNAGNQRIAIAQLGHCIGPDDNQCQWQTLNRNLYPGTSLTLPAPSATRPVRVKFRVDDNQDLQTQDFHAPG